MKGGIDLSKIIGQDHHICASEISRMSRRQLSKAQSKYLNTLYYADMLIFPECFMQQCIGHILPKCL